MKNTLSGLLGLTLMIGSAGLTFAAQDKMDSKATSTDSTTTTTKKVKKHKKAAKPATAAPATSTPPAAK